MNTDDIPSLFHNRPCSRIGQRENPDIRLDSFFPDIPSEPVGNLLGQENGFGLSAAFRISGDSLTVFDIQGGEFQDLSYPHAASGHQLQHQPVPLVSGFENDLVYHVFFQALELCGLACPEPFPERWIVTWILDFWIKGGFHEIEKGRQ
jgi:hypothetical protein